MQEPAAIACQGVRKVFRTWRREPGLRGVLASFVRRQPVDFVALDGIDLAIEPGEFVGLIGPNGAGKTTLVKALVGILPVSQGRATLFGRDSFHLADRHKRRLSLVMGQRSQLWWDLPPIDSFRLLREIYQVERTTFERRVREYAQRLDVADRLTVQLRHLSLGQRMKMEIIGAFLHDPEIVFLDEPTIGLDLVSTETIRGFLVELNRGGPRAAGGPGCGATIVLTSHDMEDIEETCERLVILDAGRVLFDGDLVELHRRIVGRRAVQVHLEPDSPHRGGVLQGERARELGSFGAELVTAAQLSLTFAVPAERTQPFVRRLLELVAVRDLSIERQPLERLIKEIFRGRTAAAP
jgi:ABC-2 type transport system ATP-binding protein